MFGKDLPRQRANKPIQARTINRLVDAVQGLMKLRVGAGLEMKWLNGAPLIWASNAAVFQWFYTTSPITTATASATGTAIGSATMTDGYGTARRCIETGSGTSTVRTPDTGTGAADETIYLPVVTATAVATGSFVLCGWTSRWEILTVVRCPGT